MSYDATPATLAPKTAPIYQSGLNQSPIANVGKTGFYIAKDGSRTIYRFPEEHTLPDGTIIKGHRLEHINSPALRRAYRSIYPPHVGAKQRARMAATV